jgi:carbonic anhydrase
MGDAWPVRRAADVPMEDTPTMASATDLLLTHASTYPSRYAGRALGAAPTLGVAIVTCMDSRIDLFALFGLAMGEAHVVRNAGGVVTEDTVRSLAISQQELGTSEVILVHHTRCGLLGVTEEGFADRMEAAAGVRPDWPVRAFTDLDADVAESVELVRKSPFLTGSTSVRGFVFDVDTGALREVA